MAFNAPTPGDRQYRLTARSVAQVGGAYLFINCAFDCESISHDDVGPIFQDLVDTIDASPDFVVTSAARTRVHTENVTVS